jgi:L-ascorbate metabolism protein UlaG (beta-lactamase superfamily)
LKALGTRAQGQRLERMRASPGWVDGERGGAFRNRYPIAPGLRDPAAAMPSLTDFLCGGSRRVPGQPLPLHDPRATWLQRPASGLRATWLGHSSVLIEIDGAVLLTDPVWGRRASPSQLAGPKRFQSAAVPLKQLPRLDAVLLSHDHYDHLCMPTVQALARTGVPFVTSLGVGAHLEAFGVRPELITELDWWQQHTIAGTGIQVTATPSQHFSGRGLKDRNATLWSGLAVQGERHRVFFSGDTGLTEAYREIRERLGPFDLVMLEVGAHHPAWGDIHLGPANALQALQWLGGGAFLPIHWGTFSLAMHAWDEPAEVLLAQAPAQGVHLLMPMLGQAVEPAQVDAVLPWWRGVDAGGGAPAEAAITPQRWPRALPWPAD